MGERCLKQYRHTIWNFHSSCGLDTRLLNTDGILWIFRQRWAYDTGHLLSIFCPWFVSAIVARRTPRHGSQRSSILWLLVVERDTSYSTVTHGKTWSIVIYLWGVDSTRRLMVRNNILAMKGIPYAASAESRFPTIKYDQSRYEHRLELLLFHREIVRNTFVYFIVTDRS